MDAFGELAPPKTRTPSLSAKQLAEKYEIPWSENMDHESVLLEYYKKQGFKNVHLCPDWDFMAIHEDAPEFDACTCDL